MADREYTCKGCGRIELWEARRLYKGYLFTDVINGDAYCVRCSQAFARVKILPDGVAREEWK
jgi:hypothetical protein